MFTHRQFVEVGGFASYGANFPDLFRRAAGYVDKILKGADPGELPVRQPIKFELFLNLKTAKALDLTVPPSLIQLADQVIERNEAVGKPGLTRLSRRAPRSASQRGPL